MLCEKETLERLAKKAVAKSPFEIPKSSKNQKNTVSI